MTSENKLLPDGTYIFCWGGLEKNAGGMTRMTLKRLNLFAEQGVKVKFLLSSRGKEQLDGVEHYRQVGFTNITEDMFLTIDDYLEKKLSVEGNVHDAGLFKSLEELPRETVNNNTRYYKGGKLFAVEIPQAIERKRYIDFYDSNEQKRHGEIIWDGQLNRIQKYKNADSTLKTTYYFSPGGFCYMRVDEKLDGYWRIASIKLFFEKSKEIRSFGSMDDLRRYFFVEYIKEVADENIFVFCDPVLGFDPGFKDMQIEGKNIYRIGINHTGGLVGERSWYSPINPQIRDMIEKKISPDMEAFILLTKEAMGDFQKRLGNRNILYNVPNSTSIPETIQDFSARDLKRVVFVGRFDEKQKQITHIIKAWSKVEKAVPNAELYIYGRGNDEEKIVRCIAENNLKKVFIEPFTNNVNYVYQNAAFSVISSDFEGFGLCLLESLVNGCPVVTYGFKYGPKDMVEHEKNGLIIEKNNIDALSDAIISLLQNPELIRSMSEETRSKIRMYSDDRHLQNWIDVLNSLVENKKYSTAISNADFSVVSYKVNRKTGKIVLNGELVLRGRIPEAAHGMEKLYIREYNNDKTDYSIIDVNYVKSEDLCYEIDAEIPADVKNVSMCIEWNNSFAERAIDFGVQIM